LDIHNKANGQNADKKRTNFLLLPNFLTYEACGAYVRHMLIFSIMKSPSNMYLGDTKFEHENLIWKKFNNLILRY